MIRTEHREEKWAFPFVEYAPSNKNTKEERKARVKLREIEKNKENIVLSGMPGSGKSTVGMQLAQMMDIQPIPVSEMTTLMLMQKLQHLVTIMIRALSPRNPPKLMTVLRPTPAFAEKQKRKLSQRMIHITGQIMAVKIAAHQDRPANIP